MSIYRENLILVMAEKCRLNSLSSNNWQYHHIDQIILSLLYDNTPITFQNLKNLSSESFKETLDDDRIRAHINNTKAKSPISEQLKKYNIKLGFHKKRMVIKSLDDKVLEEV